MIRIFLSNNLKIIMQYCPVHPSDPEPPYQTELIFFVVFLIVIIIFSALLVIRVCGYGYHSISLKNQYLPNELLPIRIWTEIQRVPHRFCYNYVSSLFPVRRAFSMTAHKVQGQTFEYVGVDLQTSVFMNGMLYVG